MLLSGWGTGHRNRSARACDGGGNTSSALTTDDQCDKTRQTLNNSQVGGPVGEREAIRRKEKTLREALARENNQWVKLSKREGQKCAQKEKRGNGSNICGTCQKKRKNKHGGRIEGDPGRSEKRLVVVKKDAQASTVAGEAMRGPIDFRVVVQTYSWGPYLFWGQDSIWGASIQVKDQLGTSCEAKKQRTNGKVNDKEERLGGVGTDSNPE